MNKYKTLSALLLFLFLSACASKNMTEQIKPIPDTELCCMGFADYPWVTLDKNEELDFQIDETSPVGKFTEGNSYFIAFQLPANASQVHLRLASKMLNGTVFAPKLIALNKQFQLVESREIDSFDVQAADAFSRNQYLLNMILDAQKTPYFILYTKEQELGKTIEVDHPAKIRAKQFGEVMPMVTDPTYTFSHFGELSMRVATMSLKGYSGQMQEKMQADKAEAVNIIKKTKQYYFDEIEKAVKENNIEKALNLLHEAKAMGVQDVEEHFVQSVKNF